MSISRTGAGGFTVLVTASAGGCYPGAVMFDYDPTVNQQCWIQLWNRGANPGTTTPDIQIPIMTPSTGISRRVPRVKVVFDGLFFDTALTYFLSTTPSGGTASTQGAVTVDFTPQ